MDIIYRFDPSAPLSNDVPKTSDEAVARLASGNGRFADLVEHIQQSTLDPHNRKPVVIPVNPLTMGVPFVKGCVPTQAPYALVLGCSDARVPIEHILDCRSNEVFVVRVAGNVLGLECLGSIDYAITNLKSNLRVAAVLGHTGCGAVTAAVDVYLSPMGYLDLAVSHAVRSLLDRIMLAVRGSARALDSRLSTLDRTTPAYREQLIETSVFLNAAVTAYDLYREIGSLKMESVAVVYSVYDVSRTRISALPFRNDADRPTEFLPAPASAAEFMELAGQIADRVVAAYEPQS